MSKNLKDYLETLDGEKIVAIGAKDGNGFVYIGKAGNIEFIEKCYENYLAKVERKLIKNKNYLKELVMSTPNLKGDDEQDHAVIRNYVVSAYNTVRSIDSGNQYIKHYVPVMERDYIEHYDRGLDDDSEAIIIPGSEAGDFWLKSEFDKKYKL